MENFINKFIEQNVKGVDTYQHNGSIWLIFTNDKRWVIELTEDKTLWYNYTFFKSIFDFFSMDVVENQQYITKWVEDTIINRVRNTLQNPLPLPLIVEDTIQNGVRHTIGNQIIAGAVVEDTIQNGVKDITYSIQKRKIRVDDTIKKGVKETQFLNEAIEFGVIAKTP